MSVWVSTHRADTFLFHWDTRLCRFLKMGAFPAVPCSIFWCSRTRQLAREIRKLLPSRRQFFPWSSHCASGLALSQQFSLLGGVSLQVEMTWNQSSVLDFHSILHVYFHSRYWTMSQTGMSVGVDASAALSKSGAYQSYRSSSRILLPSSSIAIGRWEQTPID